MSLGRCVQHHRGSEGKSTLHAAEWQVELGGGKEESVSACLMKRIADNPHDEHLGAEIEEGAWGDFLPTDEQSCCRTWPNWYLDSAS